MLVQQVSPGSSDLLTVRCIPSLLLSEVPTVVLLILLRLTICQDLYPQDFGESQLLHGIVSTRPSSLTSLLQGNILV